MNGEAVMAGARRSFPDADPEQRINDLFEKITLA